MDAFAESSIGDELLKFSIFNSHTFVSELKGKERDTLRDILSFEVPGWQWIKRKNPVRYASWDGKKRFLDYQAQSFPSGFLLFVLNKIKKEGIQYSLADKRQVLEPLHPEHMNAHQWHQVLQKLNLDPDEAKCGYQVRGVHNLLSNKIENLPWPRGGLEFATGSGKTLLCALLLETLKRKTLFLVERLDLVAQTLDVFRRVVGDNIGRISEGEFKPDFITVSTIQTLIRKIKEDRVKRYLESVEVLILDEAQNLSGGKGEFRDRYLVLLSLLQNAYFRIAISGTLFQREDLGDAYLMGCFGSIVSTLKAKELTDQGLLARPKIKMIRMDTPGMQNLRGRDVYNEAIVGNYERNQIIVDLAKIAYNKAPTFILVRLSKHGRLLQKMLTAEGVSAPFLNYKTDSQERMRNIAAFDAFKIPLLISSSLPSKELILIRGIKNGISLVPIGEFCEHIFKTDSWEAYTRGMNGDDGWSRITNVIKHKRRNDIIETSLNGGARVLTTDNHSLIDFHGRSTSPEKGTRIQQAIFVPLNNTLNSIDVLKSLHDSRADISGIKIEVTGVYRSRVTEMRAELRWLTECPFPSAHRERQAACRVRNYKVSEKLAISVLKYFFSAVRYHKGRYYLKHLPKSADEPEALHILGLGLGLVHPASRSKWCIPLRIPITRNLARLAGIFAAEGYTGNPGPSHFMACISALIHPKMRQKEGSRGKRNIRRIFIHDFVQVLGRHPKATDRQIIFDGKIPYLFFRHILQVGGKASEKQVPWFVWNSPSKIRKAFIYGYFLGDGHRAEGKSNSIVFTTVSRKLAVGIYLLLLSLGKSRVGLGKDIKLQEKSNFLRYTINLYDPTFGFSMRKEGRYNERPFYAPVRNIKRVLQEEDLYVYDICVDSVQRFYAGFGVLCHNSIFEEGVDVRNLKFLIIASGGKSAVRTIQRLGRGLRMKKFGANTVHVVDFIDETHQRLLDNSQYRLAAYRREDHEVKIVRKNAKGV